jgi:hypothetical protein
MPSLAGEGAGERRGTEVTIELVGSPFASRDDELVGGRGEG